MNFHDSADVTAAMDYLARYLNSVLPIDCCVAVTVGDRVHSAYRGHEIGLAWQVDEPAPDAFNVTTAIRRDTGHDVTAEDHHDGRPLKVRVEPYHDASGAVIGTVILAIDVSAQKQLVRAAERVALSAHNTEQTAATLSEAAIELESLKTISGNARREITESDSALGLIREISDKTNMLGMNATIRAHQSGEEGRGIAVIAQEIRTMSKSTQDSTRDISTTLERLNTMIDQFGREVSTAAEIAGQQAAASREITEALHAMTELSDRILNISRRL